MHEFDSHVDAFYDRFHCQHIADYYAFTVVNEVVAEAMALLMRDLKHETLH